MGHTKRGKPRKVYFKSNGMTIHNGDCVEVMQRMPESSIDTVITDPPYGLEFMGKEFMGKEWDKLGATLEPVTDTANVHGNWTTKPFGGGGQRVRYGKSAATAQVFHEAWAREALRVAKPGAMLLAFGGTRTHHRLMCAIEDVGWVIRDCVMWVYAQGFPKSYNLKGKADGFDGWGTALKPAMEPIILAMKPLDGTFAQNAEKWGVGGLWIDGARVGPRDRTRYGLKRSRRSQGSTYGDTEGTPAEFDSSKGRWPANLIHDGSDEVMRLFPRTKSGAMKRAVEAYEGESTTPFLRGRSGPDNQRCDSGSAARFFYAAKASRKERNNGLPNGIVNNHPTVKPIALLEYLCNLTRTPTGGIILDPFAGSGSVGIAARRAGRKCVMIEKEMKYCVIAKYRIGNAVC